MRCWWKRNPEMVRAPLFCSLVSSGVYLTSCFSHSFPCFHINTGEPIVLHLECFVGSLGQRWSQTSDQKDWGEEGQGEGEGEGCSVSGFLAISSFDFSTSSLFSFLFLSLSRIDPKRRRNSLHFSPKPRTRRSSPAGSFSFLFYFLFHFFFFHLQQTSTLSSFCSFM